MKKEVSSKTVLIWMAIAGVIGGIIGWVLSEFVF